ncbi:UNKNOWN [Stylonychia lemnae]|uniref:Uncharacterized protein n=1 Tax=Stylonychia lemnae TaxID=5949 RepID=A0A078ASE9_STYLE|nr:UNKNOWN [Stylonychia lemnae]|eukprot:CDW84147.1 UNKNOWN [Stylonychia lemnae]
MEAVMMMKSSKNPNKLILAFLNKVMAIKLLRLSKLNFQFIGWRSTKQVSLKLFSNSSKQQRLKRIDPKYKTINLKGISMKRNKNFNKIRTQHLTSVMFHKPKYRQDQIFYQNRPREQFAAISQGQQHQQKILQQLLSVSIWYQECASFQQVDRYSCYSNAAFQVSLIKMWRYL